MHLSIRHSTLHIKKIIVATLGVIGLGGAAYAWDGAVGGPVQAFEVTDGQNAGFRVYLKGVPAMCNGGPPWAYLNESDSNYKAYLSVLMLARAQGNNVTIYSTRQGSLCRIGYILS